VIVIGLLNVIVRLVFGLMFVVFVVGVVLIMDGVVLVGVLILNENM